MVTLPLSFDVPSVQAHELCLQTYDAARAGGALPIVNSITEHRWDAMSLYAQRPVQGHRDGVGTGGGRRGQEQQERRRNRRHRQTRRAAPAAATTAWRWTTSSSTCRSRAIIADTEGLNRGTLEAVKLIGGDPELKGLHMMGGLSNIGQQLPPKAADGSDLKHQLENAFLTLAVPYGFDTVLGTPWRGYAPLPEDNYVLKAYQNFLRTDRQQRPARRAQAVQGMNPPNAFALVVDEWFDGEQRHAGPATMTIVDGRLASVAAGDHAAALAEQGLAGRARRVRDAGAGRCPRAPLPGRRTDRFQAAIGAPQAAAQDAD